MPKKSLAFLCFAIALLGGPGGEFRGAIVSIVGAAVAAGAMILEGRFRGGE